MAKLSGRDNLLKKLAALPPTVRSAIKQALAQGADDIVSEQKRLSRSRRVAATIDQWWGDKPQFATSGALVGGGAVKGDPDLTVWISAGDEDVFWARWEEFGTAPHINGGMFAGSQHPGTSPRPFFFPAFRANKRRVKSRISRATTKAVKQVASS